ncbi:methionyl-tRNA formyltransferase [Acidobacteriota bacterium]
MRILFLGNNAVGLEVLRELVEGRERVVGLVIHPPEKQRYGEEIIAASALPEEQIFDGASLKRAEVIEAIRALRPDIGLSVMFGYILQAEFLALFSRGVINLHPSLLPFNRGPHPNVWSIVEGTPAGATIHYIDEGIDTGDIIAQRDVIVEPTDTGGSLYAKLETCCVELFRETWPMIKRGTAPRIPQPPEAGTSHRIRDVELIDRIELDQSSTARALINILRARTFPPYKGAYFMDQGRRVGLRLHLEYEDDDAS